MKNQLIVITLLLSLNLHTCYSQGIWSSIKEKTKSAWNSDARRETWEKTKEVSKEMFGGREYTVPVTGRSFVNVIPDDQLVAMSEKQYRSFINSSTLSTNAKKKAQVKRVALRLKNAVKQFYENEGMESELDNFNWEFNLVRNNAVNAFCMPGGKVVVYEGILSVANDDASLAIVLGHEIAHAIAKHSAEQLTKGLMTTIGVSAVYMMVNSSSVGSKKKILTKAMASAGASLASLKFSRVDETEADRIGLILAAMAGYNPESAVPFWQRMGKASDSKSKHDWYSTHPSNANRIENIKSFIPEAKKYYNL